MLINTSIDMNKILDEMKPAQLEELIEEAQKRLKKKDKDWLKTAINNYCKWGYIETCRYIRNNSQHTLMEALEITKDIQKMLNISD